jgi:hypothetical protein
MPRQLSPALIRFCLMGDCTIEARIDPRPIARPLIAALLLLALSPVLVALSPLAVAAQEAPMGELAGESADMAQVTSVSQLSDVKPTDWAFQSLQVLVERYGCISGYPDKTFRGNRAISRSEFAAGVNACLETVAGLVTAAGEDQGKQADLARLQQLQTEFAAELATLRGRADGLEAKTATLAQQQFSTTTRLFGQTVIGLQGTNQPEVDFFPKDGVKERRTNNAVSLGYNLQLSLATTFRGDDLLLMGLQAGNVRSNAPTLFTNMARLGYESETSSSLVLSDLSYRFALTPNIGVVVGPMGVNPESTFRGINPLEGYGDGAISLLGQRNPILGLGNTNGGIGFDWEISYRTSLQAIYSAAMTGDFGKGVGLFGDRTTLGAQLTLAPTDTVDVGINYLFSRSPDGVIGPGVGDAQVLSPFSTATGFDTHAIGATAAWRITPKWTIGSWGGWTSSKAQSVTGSVQTTNWMLFSAFPDLLVPGNMGGIMLGQPPKITNSTLPDGLNFPSFSTDGKAGGQSGSAIHLEAFYRARLSNQISVTPGLLMIFNPNHNESNGTVVQGLMRATYRF